MNMSKTLNKPKVKVELNGHGTNGAAKNAARLPVMKTYKIFIGGKFPRTESGRYYQPTGTDGKPLANVCRGSRKDVRDAVVAARGAVGGWASRSAFNRGQILYRIGEMLEGRSAQFVHELVLHGATPSPFDALNALRGIRTLSVRTTHQSDSAFHLADSLAEHPKVTAVHYPGLASHPQADLAKKQMRHGGTVISIELADGIAGAERFLERVQLLHRATSLGGPETLVCHPATTTHASLTPDEAAHVSVTPGMLRISVGLEDPVDVLRDVLQALD